MHYRQITIQSTYNPIDIQSNFANAFNAVPVLATRGHHALDKKTILLKTNWC